MLRTKEIGVRKVFGASTTGLIFMLFKNIAMLIIVASVLASVISFWAVEEWLRGFSYRIDLSGFNLMSYVVATMLATGVAFATMAAQSYKTTQANPVVALRYE